MTPRELQEPFAAGGGEADAGRVVEGRDGVEQARPAAGRAGREHGRLEGVHVEPLVVEGDAGDRDGVVGDDAESEVVRGALDEDDVARLREEGHHLVEGLRVAAGDEDVAGGDGVPFASGRPLRDRRPQLFRTLAGPVGERGGALRAERSRRRVADEPDREQRRVGLAEGELDDAVAEGVLGEEGRLAHAVMIRHPPRGAATAVSRGEPRLAAGRPFP